MAGNPHYQYSTGDHPDSHTPDARFDLPRGQCLYFEDWRLVARDCAEDYYSNHDGWESAWPLEFRIYKDATCMWQGLVELEMEPSFYVQH